MQRETVEAISRKLYQEFGAGYAIYADAPKQHLTEPCFYICPLAVEHVPKLGTAYRRKQSFDIHYFPKAKQSSGEISETEERLYDCLEYIALDGKLYRGTELKAEKRDEVLHFMVDYSIPLRKPEKPDFYMEELEVKGMVR